MSCQTMSTIQGTRLVPTHPEIADLTSIAITQFYSFGEETDLLSAQLQMAIEEKLTENGHFIVKKIPKPMLRRPTPLAIKKFWYEQGAKENIDALVSGEIDLARIELRSVGEEEIQEKRASLVLQINVVSLQQEKRLTGERLMIQETSSAVPEEMLPNDEQMMARVTESMAEKVVEFLTPHVLEQEIGLLRTPATAEGLRYAKEGEWGAAIYAWDQALLKNPENHTVLYNLGATSEFLGAYERAKEYYKQAHLLSEKKKLYRQALDRMIALLKEKENGTTSLPIIPAVTEESTTPETDEVDH